MERIRDQYGRSFKTLRVSLINTCNLSCVYCTYGNEEIRKNHQEAKDSNLTPDELITLISMLHQELALETVRFTGGEPLLYHDLLEVVKKTTALGIPNLKLTTNGVLLANQAGLLKAAGISGINISLDSLDPKLSSDMTKRNALDKTLQGIEAAIETGIDVKINSVIMRGINDSQILPLLDYAGEKRISIRFLEIMAMGHLYESSEKYFFSEKDILERIGSVYRFQPLPRKASATANYWQTEQGAIFGIVANTSEPFCSDCNRLRIDSKGNIFGCLSNNAPVPISAADERDTLRLKLKTALYHKQAVRFRGSELSMLSIGG